MIKKMRVRFIALSMLSLTAVVAVILVSIAATAYAELVHDADKTLTLLAANDGRFPLRTEEEGPPSGQPRPPFSPELPFESRFFSVLIGDDGTLIRADTEHIAAIDRENAVSMARSVAKQQRGFSDHYRFTTVQREGETLVIFLDCTRSLETFWESCSFGLLISLGGILAVFVLILLLSKRIVRPFAQNYEKQKRFITDAGHDLKTPLTVIDADVEILMLDMGENEWLSDIRKQTAQLSHLTNDLIYLSRMDEERSMLNRIVFPLSDMISETTQSFSSLARLQKKLLRTQIEPMLSCHGDEKALSRLLGILLDNALKYSPENTTIDLILRKQGKHLVLTLSNSVSEPLKQEELSHLFDRFYRADPSRSGSGHGIGLSIARAIVTAHGGRITVTAPEERRICFQIILPQ